MTWVKADRRTPDLSSPELKKAPMTALQWTDDFALGVPQMDATHQEFVALLADVDSAADATLLVRWQALVDHTAEHFSQEDRWMLATRFAATNCHTMHHQAVLGVMREGLAMGRAGDLAPVRQMARELTTWFPLHADSMDAALAWHLKRVGYDPVSGSIAHPELLPGELIHGCGGETCSDENVPAADTAPTPASA